MLGEMIKDDVTVAYYAEGHDGPGWYWHYTDSPEDGVAGAFASFEAAKASAERNDGVVTSEPPAAQKEPL